MENREEIELFSTAKDLINQFSVVLRTSHIHNPNNIAVTTVIDKLVPMINHLVRSERMIVLELRGEFFYLNDFRIRYSVEHLLNFDFLVREFRKRELGSIVFKGQDNAG